MNDKNDKQSRCRNAIKQKIADHLGIDADDINDDDGLRDDLHMNSSEISDLMLDLKNEGMNIDAEDFESAESLEDLVDIVCENEDF